MWEKTGKKPKGLIYEPLPDTLRYIWDVFLDLMGGENITYTEILSYSKINRINITGEETRIIKTLERIYWRIMNDH